MTIWNVVIGVLIIVVIVGLFRFMQTKRSSGGGVSGGGSGKGGSGGTSDTKT